MIRFLFILVFGLSACARGTPAPVSAAPGVLELSAPILPVVPQVIPGNMDVPQPAVPIIPVAPRPPEADIINSLDVCGHKLSEARKRIVAAQIYRISGIYLPRREHRDAFVGLLCIESKFEANAKSHMGATGMAQIMPKYAPYFAEQCSLGVLDTTDLTDTELNLTLGACHFSHLLRAFDGNIALALSGYNSGQDSETTKRLDRLATGHVETMGYISKFYSYINKVQIAREGGGK